MTMLTGTEILDRADEGDDRIRWAIGYAEKVCTAHGLTFSDYLAEYRLPLSLSRVDAAGLLGWMGY